MADRPKPRETLPDRIVNWLDPVRGLRRAKARQLSAVAGAYVGASRRRKALADWNPRATDADGATLDDLPTLRRRSSDARRNISLAAGALATQQSSVIGPGLRLQPMLDADFLGMSDEQADAWERNVEGEFALWAESVDCDAERALTFDEMQALAFVSSAEKGDVFALLPSLEDRGVYGLAVQLLEAERCSNPLGRPDTERMRGGVELDESGAPVAYHFSRHHPGTWRGGRGVGANDWQRVTAYGAESRRRNVLHVLRKERVGQHRGVPVLAPILEPLKQVGRYTDAELMGAVVASMFTIFVKTEQGDGLGWYESDDAPTQQQQGQTRDYELGNGAIVEMLPGDDVTAPAPGRPNDAFDPFVTACFRQIGVALEMPYEVLIKHFTASYSASRAAIEEFWKYVRTRRAWMARQFCQPVYEQWLEEAIALGRIVAPGYIGGDPRIRAAYAGALWVGPPKGQINERVESEAAEKRIDIGISTIAQETAMATGGNWRHNLRQRRREQSAMAAAAESASAPAPVIDTETTVHAALRARD